METSYISNIADYNEWSPNYGNLPMEIILHIFRFLNYSDLQACGATCCRWREAIFVGEFNRNVLVHFIKVCLSERLAPAKFFLKCQRPYRSFCLEEVTFGQAQELFIRIGKTATSIAFDNADMGDKQFYGFMRQLTHIESLTITRCSPLFMSGSFLDGCGDFAGTFSNIKHLSLKHNQYLSDAILLRLTSLIKGIESLDMSGCHIAYHNAIHRRFCPNDSVAANPSESILTFKFLARVANSHRNYLKELNLSHTMISGPALQSLTSQENKDGGLSLHKLRLAGCRQLNYSGVKSFLETQGDLVLLDLADTLCVNDDCVSVVVNTLPKLKHLNVSGCSGITNVGAIFLGNLKYLKSLNISHCDGITTDGITQDLQACGATCCRWREAIFVGEFNRNVLVHFIKVCLSDRLAPAKFFLKSQRPYRSFCLEEVTFGQAQELFIRIGKTATSIAFDNADMGDKQFYGFMRQLTHIESLTITRCSPLFMSGSFLDGCGDFAGTFSNIKHLSLKHNQYLSDAILLRLTSLIKGIESLDMSGCHIAYHNAIHRRFYPNDSVAANPSESILTFKFLARVANSHRNYLKELNLSHTMISGPALQSLTSQENKDGGLALHKLRLAGCRQLNYSGVKSFLETQGDLVLLDLADTLCVNDDCVSAVVNTLPKLKHLNVSGCSGITNVGAIFLGNLKYLKSLNISHCDGITTDGITQGIARCTNLVLKYLYMTHLIVCEESIKCIAQHCPELRILNVGHCVNGVTDTSVQYIIEHLRWLRELSLEDCFRVTDAALTGINISKLEIKHSSNLSTGSLENFHPTTPSSWHELENLGSNNSPQSLKISLRTKAEEDIVRDANRKRALFAVYEVSEIDDYMIDGFSIQQLRGLRTLNLKGCNKITDVSLKYGLKFIELQHLYLSNCQQITLTGMESLVLNCPSIEEIDLSDCYNINDKTIQLLTAKFKRLRALHISGCTQLTDHSLDAILVNCKCLQTLSIYRCRRMYSDIEDRLGDLSTLRHLNMDNVGSLDNVEFFRLKKRLDY